MISIGRKGRRFGSEKPNRTAGIGATGDTPCARLSELRALYLPRMPALDASMFEARGGAISSAIGDERRRGMSPSFCAPAGAVADQPVKCV